MQLGEIIRSFSSEADATESLLGCDDVALLARIGKSAAQYDETVGEYAAGAVRRFANLGTNEDWLGLMNVLERTDDPGIGCLTYMIGWSLTRDEAAIAHAAGCGCGGQ